MHIICCSFEFIHKYCIQIHARLWTEYSTIILGYSDSVVFAEEIEALGFISNLFDIFVLLSLRFLQFSWTHFPFLSLDRFPCHLQNLKIQKVFRILIYYILCAARTFVLIIANYAFIVEACKADWMAAWKHSRRVLSCEWLHALWARNVKDLCAFTLIHDIYIIL